VIDAGALASLTQIAPDVGPCRMGSREMGAAVREDVINEEARAPPVGTYTARVTSKVQVFKVPLSLAARSATRSTQFPAIDWPTMLAKGEFGTAES
jgi:hypothetical protein